MSNANTSTEFTFDQRPTGGFEIKNATGDVVGHAAEHGPHDSVYARIGKGRWGFYSSRYAVRAALKVSL